MKTEMLMPQMGESIAEATVLKWRKGVGDEVSKDEMILDIATDKVDSEIPAPESGVIVEIRAQEGETVPVKSIVAVIESDKSTAVDAIKAAPMASAPAPQTATPAATAAAPVSTKAPTTAPAASRQVAAPTATSGPAIDMVMPQMGESIAEATILKWLKNVGDIVTKDETILEISTDKVDSEIPAPATGILLNLLAKEGDTVPVKSVIAKIGQANGKGVIAESPTASTPAAPTARVPQAATAAPSSTTGTTSRVLEPSAGAAASAAPTRYGQKFFSPLIRSLASEHGVSPVELSGIPGTGAHGRLTKGDFMRYLEHRGSTPAPTAATTAPSTRPSQPVPAAPKLDYGPDGTRIEEMDNMRKLIAKHMVMSKATSPHVYSTAEVDVTPIVKWRSANQKEFVAREGFKLSFTPFFLEAAVKALVNFPYINASIDGEKIILKRDVNLGCAVALESGGLIVPVIKNADQLSLAGLARALNDIATRARSKQLKPDDIQGGTFTVTNPGIFGNIIGNPIINQPQLAILAIGAIKKRPAVVNDMIGIRDIVYLTLSYDHRLVDGSLAGRFLQFITEHLEGWEADRAVF